MKLERRPGFLAFYCWFSWLSAAVLIFLVSFLALSDGLSDRLILLLVLILPIGTGFLAWQVYQMRRWAIVTTAWLWFLAGTAAVLDIFLSDGGIGGVLAGFGLAFYFGVIASRLRSNPASSLQAE